MSSYFFLSIKYKFFLKYFLRSYSYEKWNFFSSQGLLIDLNNSIWKILNLFFPQPSNNKFYSFVNNVSIICIVIFLELLSFLSYLNRIRNILSSIHKRINVHMYQLFILCFLSYWNEEKKKIPKTSFKIVINWNSLCTDRKCDCFIKNLLK